MSSRFQLPEHSVGPDTQFPPEHVCASAEEAERTPAHKRTAHPRNIFENFMRLVYHTLSRTRKKQSPRCQEADWRCTAPAPTSSLPASRPFLHFINNSKKTKTLPTSVGNASEKTFRKIPYMDEFELALSHESTAPTITYPTSATITPIMEYVMAFFAVAMRFSSPAAVR